jgi:hypothetical protein
MTKRAGLLLSRQESKCCGQGQSFRAQTAIDYRGPAFRGPSGNNGPKGTHLDEQLLAYKFLGVSRLVSNCLSVEHRREVLRRVKLGQLAMVPRKRSVSCWLLLSAWCKAC